MIQTIPFRFILFGAICTGWLAALHFDDESTILRAAGATWFATWTVQATVSLALWIRPFSLPERYYRPRPSRRLRQLARALGMRLCRRIAQWVNPFPCERRSLPDLEAAIDAAETTHIVAFAILTVVAIAFALGGDVWNAFFLVLWNTLCNLYPAALQRHTRLRLRISRGCPMRTTDPSRTSSHRSIAPLASTTIVEP
jgi:hypothetical protein